MPTSTPGSDKSRQSSGGKSFFGRKLHKERPPSDDRSDSHGGAVAHGQESPNSYRSPRHSRFGSAGYIEPEDYQALNHTAGVITSIPFENMPSDLRSPVPVDYLHRAESNAWREPSPSHLAKSGGDFHQYPAWDPKNVHNGYGHLNGPRPSSHASNITMTCSSTGDRGPRYQQWGRPGSSAANTGFSYTSSSTTGDSSNSRLSIDQASVYSSQSSATRYSYLSDSNSSRTVVSSSHPAPTMASSSTPTPINPAEYLTRPKDDRVVDQLFLELMHKRGWQNLPEQAKRQMLAYPAAKKWTLVHQDRLTELKGEQRRKNARLAHGDGPSSILDRAEEEGTPEWYVKKIMDDTITSKQLGSLSVSLRTQPIRYATLRHKKHRHHIDCFPAGSRTSSRRKVKSP